MAALDPQIAATLRQGRATEQEFRAWCLEHGLTRFESYPDENKRGFLADFLAARGGSVAVTSPRPTLAAGRPTLDPVKPGKRVIRNASGVIEEIGLNAMTARHRERVAAQREALDEAGRSGSCSCDLNKMCPEHARRVNEIRDRFY